MEDTNVQQVARLKDKFSWREVVHGLNPSKGRDTARMASLQDKRLTKFYHPDVEMRSSKKKQPITAVLGLLFAYGAKRPTFCVVS
jgi:hypothetical protein